MVNSQELIGTTESRVTLSRCIFLSKVFGQIINTLFVLQNVTL
jgi:hypothetical protein